jgi:PPOX class probable F420-dependent enzyme
MTDLSPAVEERLRRASNIWLATARPDGRPHLVPVWFAWHAGRLYFCTDPESVKAHNIRANPRVVLALEDGSKPVICEGAAESIDDGAWPEGVAQAFSDKYAWDIATETRYRLLIEVTPRKWLTW